MTFSKLYRFVNDEILDKTSEESNLDPHNFSSKTDQMDNNYFLYDLKLRKKNNFITHNNHTYQLNSHHISIYKFQDDQNPFLSEYHYTASFSNQDGKNYGLHVYFNHNDQLTIEPIFSTQEDGATHWDEKNHALCQNLISFAVNESVGFVTSLRKKQREHFTNLERQYLRLESELSALSTDLIQNQNHYVSLSQDAIRVLETLSYYNVNKHYSSLVTIHQRIIRDMELLGNNPTTELEEPELSDKENVDTQPIDMHKNAVKKPVKIPLHSLVQLACKSKDNYLAAKKIASTTPMKIQVALFLQFHQDIYEALLLSDDTRYHATISDLQRIQKLICECTKEGKGLVGYLFVLKEYTLAERLSPYINLVQNDLFSMALTVDNSELLELLLKHSEIAVNTFIVKDTLTPLLFCFEKSRNRCFSVLLKHGASLMVQASDGLPLAHHILSDIDHPLVTQISASLSHDALIKLYQSVSNIVETYLAFQMPDTNQTRKLQSSLKQYHSHVSLLKELRTPMSQHQYQKAQTQSSNIVNKFVASSDQNAQLLKNVREDNFIQAKILTYNRLVKSFIAKLSPMEKRRELKIPQKLDFDQLMKHGDFATKNLKADMIDFLDQRIRLIELKIELKDLQINSSRNRKPKNINALIARERELVRDINELSQVLYPNPAENLNERLKFANSFSQISDHLTKIAEATKTLQKCVNNFTNMVENNSAPVESDLNHNLFSKTNIEAINSQVANNLQTNSADFLSILGLFCEGNSAADTQGVDVKENEDVDVKIDSIENETHPNQP